MERYENLPPGEWTLTDLKEYLISKEKEIRETVRNINFVVPKGVRIHEINIEVVETTTFDSAFKNTFVISAVDLRADVNLDRLDFMTRERS